MELSVVSESTVNSATPEDEAVNDDVNVDAVAADADEVVLQLTVDDDPGYSSSSANPLVSKHSVLTTCNTCLTESIRNMPSSLPKNILSGKTVIERKILAAAQCEVFRQYLLGGDIQARISELDNFTGPVVCILYLN